MNPIYGKTNLSPKKLKSESILRCSSVIGLKPEMEEYYRQLHANVWDSVLDRLKGSNIQNYSIYVTELEGKKYLFSYFEYVGDDFAADMQAIAVDPETQRWWKETDPCQIRLPNRKAGANWSELEMVFLME